MNKFPPDYKEVLKDRLTRLKKINANPALQQGAKAYYKDKPHEFINDWAVTYDPRNSAKNLPTTLPFILFPRQHEFIDFLLECFNDQEPGLCEKSRDMGATWVCCAFSIWLWLFVLGVSIGWGSRKEINVDRKGDTDSIFEKMRMIIDNLPRFFWPKGFKLNEHATYMKIINPETGSTITGEAGDNIGRGGRKAIYVVDEFAHVERAGTVQAALSDNTKAQIDISSVKGTNTLFHHKRKAGIVWEPGKKIESGFVRVFIFDWRDHPLKTQEWYDKRRAQEERAGLLHNFAQEVDRDPSAAVEGIIIPSIWVKASIDAHIKLGFEAEGLVIGGLDVADEGGDKNALAVRKGPILKDIISWAQGDTGQTANKAVLYSKLYKINSLQYDCIGVGAGVKAETNRLGREGKLPKHLDIVPWNAGAGPLFPKARIIPGDIDSPRNKDFYANLKAQAWWQLRIRFEKTYKAVIHGEEYDHEELISLPSGLKELHQLVDELSQAILKPGSLKILVDKKPSGTKSPNLADAVAIAFWPIQKRRVLIGHV